MNRKLLKNSSFILLSALIIGSIFSVLLPKQTYAAGVTGFNPGNIMSDQVFTNFRTMSKNDIQRFLNAKGSGCSGSLCLKNYQQGGRSAAQIIYDTAQKYRINPQALIVLVQKEVGLVTDTAPQAWQYKTATGYGCPDTAACDSKYYGFTNQLKWSGTMFRAILDNSPTWYAPYTVGKNNVYYHPDLSRCKSSTVTIQNRTTAALYSYTPYQPNRASLNAGYGMGDSCSSYGNRNFYQYFKDWFGSTYVPLVFKTTKSDQAYLLSGSSYVRIPSVSLLSAYGFSRSDIGVVTPNMLSLFSDGGTLKNVARFGGNEIYLIDQGKRLQFPSRDMYEAHGYTMGNEISLDAGTLAYVGAGSDVTDILQAKNQPEVYLIDKTKQHISSPLAYTTMGSPSYSSRALTRVSSDYINSKALGAPIIAPNSVVKGRSETFFWDGVSLQRIDSRTASETGVPVDYSSSTVEQLPVSAKATINQLVKNNSDGALYILNGRQKLHVASSDLASLGLSSTSFVSVSPAFLNSVPGPTAPFVALVRVNGTDPVYIVQNGKRYHLTSQAALAQQGFSLLQTISLNARSASLFPDSGKKILALGDLYRIGNTDSIYFAASNSTNLRVSSPSLMQAYGYSMRSVRSYSSSQVSNYVSAGILSHFAKSQAGQLWLIDSGGTKRKVSSSLAGSTYYNIAQNQINVYSDDMLQRFPTKADMTPVLQVGGQDRVYKIENGKKRWITSRAALSAAGYDFSSVRVVSPITFYSFPVGANL